MRLCTGLRLTPQRFALPRLSAPASWSRPVSSIYEVRDGIPYVEDQGNKPICVAKTAEQWLQIRHWRRTHERRDWHIADDLYAKAKAIDGLGGGDGTTPEAMFEVLKMEKYLSDKAELHYLAEYDDLLWAMASHGPCWASFHIPVTFQDCDEHGFFKDSHSYSGYHEMLALQYDESRRYMNTDFSAVLNSWGLFGWMGKGIARFTPDQMGRYFVGGHLVTDLEQRGCV